MLRRAAVAGSWYPGTARSLEQAVDACLAEVPPHCLQGRLLGLVAPHAGMVYSGGVAAHAYAMLRGQRDRTVILAGPSHRLAFEGVAVCAEGEFETPLGRIPIDQEAPVHYTRPGAVRVHTYSGADYIAGSPTNEKFFPGMQCTDDLIFMALQGSTQGDGLSHIILDDAHHDTREFVMQQYALNPGCLYYVPKVESDGSGILAEPRGYFQLWNPRALSIRGRLAENLGPCSEHFCSAGGVDTHFSTLWPHDKPILLYDLPCKHWTHEERWNHAPARGWRQVGMLTVQGLIPVEGGLTSNQCLLLLTDTSDPERQEVVPWRKGIALPPETMRVTPEGEMVFLGKNIGQNHLHVAQWFEKGVD